MTITFRPAKREAVGLLIGLAGASGSGKTYSALELAKGLSAGKRFAIIDTEAGRAKHYADAFDFDHADLGPPFRPEAYADAIAAAEAAGYGVIVVDSFSHEHAGDGGLLDWHEEEFQRLGGRDSVKMTAWIKPKMAHRKMVSRLLQVRSHLILCFRAQEAIEIIKENGKTVIRPKSTLTGLDGWQPISERTLPYELTLSFLLTPDDPGVPKPIKLQAQHRSFVPLDRPLASETGVALAEWARGGEAKQNGRKETTSVGQLSELPGETFEDVFEGSVATDAGDVKATPSQKKKLDVLVGQLRESGHLHTEHLYQAVARMRESDLQFAGVQPPDDGEAHWSPLRENLSRDEASNLIDRLSTLQSHVEPVASRRADP